MHSNADEFGVGDLLLVKGQDDAKYQDDCEWQESDWQGQDDSGGDVSGGQGWGGQCNG